MSRIISKIWAVPIAGLLALFSGCSGPPQDVALSIGSHTVQAEVAATPEIIQQGLSQRPNLAENQGMLFLFPTAATQCLWMRDTLLPLSAAFLDAEGRILNIVTMQPNTLEIHCSEGDSKYALEMNAGWFAERGIHAHSRISGLP